ncbi:MAG: hypothetical protein H0U85_05755 [Gemmatimonadales bacterium]|nr:hypothetical protein [Gemmatimonadales bacterium]MBA3689667.1 hypothetical protein [Chloroflexota bacterium]
MAIAIPRALERVAQDAELRVAPDERDRLRAARTAELGETPRVDRRRQWAYADNVRHNAGIRGTLHTISAPLRWVRRGDRSQPLDRNHLP